MKWEVTRKRSIMSRREGDRLKFKPNQHYTVPKKKVFEKGTLRGKGRADESKEKKKKHWHKYKRGGVFISAL